MTNQEAIKRIEEHIAIHKYRESHAIHIVEALEMAISALEKQIPVKPIRIDKNKEVDGNWKKVCPLCGRMLIERITTAEESYPRHYNYTGHCWCGQAIDWEEEPYRAERRTND